MKKRNAFRRVQIAAFACLLLGIFLLVSACSGYSSPGTQPNGTPSNGGYSVIYQVIQEAHLLQSLLHR
jgi:hypothetical protein